MNIKRAIESNCRFRHTGHDDGNWWTISDLPILLADLTPDQCADLLTSDNWEIEEPEQHIKPTAYWDAVAATLKENGFQPNDAVVTSLFAAVATRLGLNPWP